MTGGNFKNIHTWLPSGKLLMCILCVAILSFSGFETLSCEASGSDNDIHVTTKTPVDLLVNYSVKLNIRLGPLNIPEKTFDGLENFTKAVPVYTTSDPSVATVDESGVVTGVGDGVATITISDKYGNYDSEQCTVTVQDRAPIYSAVLFSASNYEEPINEGDPAFNYSTKKFEGLLKHTQYADRVFAVYDFTKADMKAWFDKLERWNSELKLTRFDVTLVYIATHGVETSKNHGVGFSTVKDGEYVTYAELKAGLDRSNSTFIVIADACFSGELITDDMDTDWVNVFLNLFREETDKVDESIEIMGPMQSGKYYVLTAASYNEPSKIWPFLNDDNGNVILQGALQMTGHLMLYDWENQCDGTNSPFFDPDMPTKWAEYYGTGKILTLGEMYKYITDNIPAYEDYIRSTFSNQPNFTYEPHTDVWPENSDFPLFIFTEGNSALLDGGGSFSWLIRPQIAADDIQPAERLIGVYSGGVEGYYDSQMAIWKDGRAGLIDYTGKMLIPCEYDMVFVLDPLTHRYGVKQDGQYYEFRDDELLVPYDDSPADGEVFFYLWDEEKDTLMNVPGSFGHGEPDWDVEGVHIIREGYNENRETKGRIPYGGYGLASPQGIIVQPDAEYVMSLNEPHYDYSSNDWPLYACFAVYDGQTWDYYNADGEIIITGCDGGWMCMQESLFTAPIAGKPWPFAFSEGCLAIGQNGKWGFCDYEGNIVVPMIFEAARPVYDGCAWVKYNGLWGVIRVKAAQGSGQQDATNLPDDYKMLEELSADLDGDGMDEKIRFYHHSGAEEDSEEQTMLAVFRASNELIHTYDMESAFPRAIGDYSAYLVPNDVGQRLFLQSVVFGGDAISTRYSLLEYDETGCCNAIALRDPGFSDSICLEQIIDTEGMISNGLQTVYYDDYSSSDSSKRYYEALNSYYEMYGITFSPNTLMYYDPTIDYSYSLPYAQAEVGGTLIWHWEKAAAFQDGASISVSAQTEHVNLQAASNLSEGTDTVRIIGDVNLRSGPGIDASEIAVIPEGSMIPYMGQESYDDRGVCWYMVEHDGQEGWVSSKYAQLSDVASQNEEVSESVSFVTATNGDTYLRSGPGRDYDQLGVLKQSMQAEFLGGVFTDDRGVDWYEVRFNGVAGWVSSKYTVIS